MVRSGTIAAATQSIELVKSCTYHNLMGTAVVIGCPLAKSNKMLNESQW